VVILIALIRVVGRLRCIKSDHSIQISHTHTLDLLTGNENDLCWAQEGEGSSRFDRIPQGDLQCLNILMEFAN
jgi:hypothetical protein